MAKRATNNDPDNRKLFAFFATFLTIVGFVIALIAKRDDDYIMFYAKQGLVLFIYAAIIGLVDKIFFSFLASILWIFWIVIWVMSWINALSGKKKYTILVSELADKINL